MAIAKTRTQLNLDRYAKIMGISPVMFSGGSPISLSSGAVLFPMDNAQNDVWPQYDWQNSDMISRESLARQIALCENEIGDFFGYDFTPRFIVQERHPLPLHYRPEMNYAAMEYGVSGLNVGVPVDHKYFILGGRRACSFITCEDVVYSDPDADGWNELATITVNVPTTITDLSEVKVYFTGFSGSQEYEIREFKTKSYAAPILTFTFYSWQMVNPDLYEAFPTSNGGDGTVDMEDPNTFVLTVDIYREYVDTTQNHVVFSDVNMSTSAITETGGFIYRLMDDGVVIPSPGTYDAVNGWVAGTSTCMSPQYADLWYYAGMRNRPGKHPYSDDYLPDDVAMAIAYMATSRLEKVFYANNNATALAASLREELNQGSPGTFRMTPGDVIQNPFGVRKGEWLAWRMLYRYKPLRRTGGAL